MPKKKLAAPVRPQTLIAVRDVRASSRWYRRLLGAIHIGRSDHRHLYDRLYVGESLILQLHAWDLENHANLVDRRSARPGHGVLLWFELDDFDAAVKRARALRAKIVEEPHVNPAPAHREMWLRDPDGYFVVIYSPDGESPAVD